MSTEVTAERLIAQIKPQCKLATLGRTNQTIRFKNEFFKANENASEGVVM
jgi:hypothetical protein